MAFPIRPALHVVAEQDDPRGAPQIGEVDRLIAAVQTKMNPIGLERQARLINAFDPVETFDAPQSIAAGPALAGEGPLDLGAVLRPPTPICCVDRVGPRRNAECRVDDYRFPAFRVFFTPGFDALNVFDDKGGAGGDDDDDRPRPSWGRAGAGADMRTQARFKRSLSQ